MGSRQEKAPSGRGSVCSVGVIVAGLAECGGPRDSAIVQFRAVAFAAAAVLLARRGIRVESADDLASQLVCDQLANGFADLYRCDSEASAFAWCYTVLRRQLARLVAQRCKEVTWDPEKFDHVVACTPSQKRQTRREVPERSLKFIGDRSLAKLLAGRLTPRQQEAVNVLTQSRSLRDASRRMGVEWRSFRDLLQRAASAVASPQQSEDRSWAPEMVQRLTRSGAEQNAAILHAWAEGEDVAKIGAQSHPPLTRLAVRRRIQRMRRVARQLGLCASSPNLVVPPCDPLGSGGRPFADGQFTKGRMLS